MATISVPNPRNPANDGKYIGECSKLALMPWRIDTRILGYPDPEVRLRARRVMLSINQFIYIKSESVNLRPIFHASQVPIAALTLGRYARGRVEELSEFFIVTHQIERLGGVCSSITSTAKPWGRTHRSLERLDLIVHGRPRLQEFVILRRDLALFCKALDGADSGYHRFGACTRHTLTVHDNKPAEDIPVLDPSNFLKPYLDTLHGFKDFTIHGSIKPDVARDIETSVSGQIATPRIQDILEDVNRKMSQADGYLNLERPIQAAHTYARASQGLVWLYSRGILPRGTDFSPCPELAELFFELDLRQAEAWLIVMQKRHDAAEGVIRSMPEKAQSRGDHLEDRGDPTKYSSLVDLVHGTVIHQIPPPLEHRPSLHQAATQLYHTVKAERLGDRGTVFTWTNINNALRMAPDDDEIRREAELIRRRMSPWTLRWIPE
ncbi:hypothetical protein INS49_009757 [Diaporthe citri]|uniref:uncharacterized protein n=1 Tax=Diaporthe citri TaxID=83186 RepID=UPI001C7E43E1|nr:uncharacterized protein INS49_009757 [Diaporthe citri]KAG6361530.1 hypothetical protein INS49_009757 [Diaporthe citri]